MKKWGAAAVGACALAGLVAASLLRHHEVSGVELLRRAVAANSEAVPHSAAAAGAVAATVAMLPEASAVAPSSPADDAAEAPGRGQQVSRRLLSERRNVFFDPRVFVEDALARNDGLVPDLEAFLGVAPGVAAGPLLVAQPQLAVVERMAAVDMLGHVWSSRATEHSADQAEAALLRVALAPLPARWPHGAQRVFAGERYDAFVWLARRSSKLALATLARVSPGAQRHFFTGAVRAGLLDAGATRSQLAALVDPAVARQREIDG